MLRRHLGRPLVAAATVQLAALVIAGPGASPLPLRPAHAAAERQAGFWAVVDGYRGWFGTYAMGALGTAWCVDHDLPAPDPDYRYAPAPLGDKAPEVRQAMAWALGAHGPGADRVTAAALMLALHDLADAAYPSGPLRLDALDRGGLRDFEGLEDQVLARARTIKADALAHARLRRPLRLTARADEVRVGQTGTLVVRVADAAGAGVAGVPVRVKAEGAVLAGAGESRTDHQGEQRFSFRAGRGDNRFEVTGTVPSLELDSFAPSTRRAQRVARPARVPLTADARFRAPGPRLTVRKTGDAAAYLPLAGARFQVHGRDRSGAFTRPAGELTSDAQGRSAAVELEPGTYQVVETAPPPGYSGGGPWLVQLQSEDQTLDVPNAARRGGVRISKTDALTRRPVAGAAMSLSYDADRDGLFETGLAPLVSGREPVTRTGLLPGDYRLVETSPPPGYQAAEAVPFTVAPGRTTPVNVANRPVTAPRVLGSRTPGGGGELPRTGAAVGALSLGGTGLLATGATLVGIAGSPGRRARRRSRRRARALARDPAACRSPR